MRVPQSVRPGNGSAATVVSRVAVLMLITFLFVMLLGRVSDRTSVLVVAHPSEDVDTLTEQMFVIGSVRA